MERGVTTILAPANTASGFEVLVDEVATFLEVIDAFNAVAPSELLSDNLGLLNVDPLLPHKVLPHLEHGDRVLVRILRIEIIRRRFIELHMPLLPSHSSLCSFPVTLSFSLSFSFWLPAISVHVG